MKRLISVLLVLVIVIAALAVIISVAASAGRQVSGQEIMTDVLEPERSDAAILYVKPAGTGDCKSWANACKLQTALAEVITETEIWVAAGTHYPDEGSGQSDDDRSSTFHLEDDVTINGGFTGDETANDQRDWILNVTVLSGDIDGNDTTDANGMITDTANITGTNSYQWSQSGTLQQRPFSMASSSLEGMPMEAHFPISLEVGCTTLVAAQH